MERQIDGETESWTEKEMNRLRDEEMERQRDE